MPAATGPITDPDRDEERPTRWGVPSVLAMLVGIAIAGALGEWIVGAAIVLLLAGFRLGLTLGENRRLLGLTRAEAARVYAILASTGNAIIGTDGQGRITFVNGAVATLTRRPEALLQGILVSDLVTDPRVATDLEATLRDGAQRVGEAVSELGGRDVTIEYKSMPIEMGGVVTGAVVSLTDVTERCIAEAALRQSEAHLAEAQRLAGIGSWRFDMADNVLHTSAEMSNLVGYDMSGSVFDPELMLEVIHPDDRGKFQAGLERCITSEGPQGIDYRLEVDGELRMIHLQVECQRADDGTPVAIVGTCLNVTDRMHRHDAERANEAKSAFLSRMSHELRTPLNSILGFGQLMQMDALDSRQSQHVDHILKAGGHLLALIDEVLQISTVESGETSLSSGPVGVAGVASEVAELLSPLATRAGVEVFVDPTCTGPVVLADPQRLHQVLVNLVSNAIKYNHPGGIVRIGTAVSGGTATITVTDSGQGIAADLLPRLFRPFDRLGREGDTTEGTGLGLSVTKALVEAMDGEITVESSVGEGSRFAVRLPAAESRQQAIAHI